MGATVVALLLTVRPLFLCSAVSGRTNWSWNESDTWNSFRRSGGSLTPSSRCVTANCIDVGPCRASG